MWHVQLRAQHWRASAAKGALPLPFIVRPTRLYYWKNKFAALIIIIIGGGHVNALIYIKSSARQSFFIAARLSLRARILYFMWTSRSITFNKELKSWVCVPSNLCRFSIVKRLVNRADKLIAVGARRTWQIASVGSWKARGPNSSAGLKLALGVRRAERIHLHTNKFSLAHLLPLAGECWWLCNWPDSVDEQVAYTQISPGVRGKTGWCIFSETHKQAKNNNFEQLAAT